MNIKEFAALKVGDKIDNPATGSHGEVVELKDTGVYVVWRALAAADAMTGTQAMRFFYPSNGTAWMNWTAVKDGGP